MYNKSTFKLIIGKVETYIKFKVGIKQGDSMDPVLFLFLMMAFYKKLEDEWTDLGLSKAQFARKDNSPIYTGQLVSHQPCNFSSDMLFDLFCMLYVDDVTFVFESKTDIKKGITLFSDHFARFGLKMYIGTEKKLEHLMRIFTATRLPLTYITNSTFYLQKKESDKHIHTREDEEYTKCRETSIIKVKGGFVTFTKNFKYLGSYISYSLRDNYVINVRLSEVHT